MDAASAAVLVTINMVLANGEMATPAGMIKKHEDFVFIAGANTFEPALIVNRTCQLDAATLDRFCFIAWDYDAASSSFAVKIGPWSRCTASMQKSMA